MVLAAEIELLWLKVGQMVCRKDGIAQSGQFCVYEIADQQFLVVRQADGSVRAFANVCRHRGNLLRQSPGRAQERRCNYHHWCWEIDGTLLLRPRPAPLRWSGGRRAGAGPGPCDTWGGFVFLNPDPEARQSLVDFLGPVATQLAPSNVLRCRTAPPACICRLPLYHTAPYGFVTGTTAVGGHAVIMDRFDTEGFLRAIEVYRATHTQVVPTMFVRLLALPEAVKQHYDLSRLQCVIHSAAPCPVPVSSECSNNSVPLFTSTTGDRGDRVRVLQSARLDDPRGTVGRPLMGAVHIVDDGGVEVAAGVTEGSTSAADRPSSIRGAGEDSQLPSPQRVGDPW